MTDNTTSLIGAGNRSRAVLEPVITALISASRTITTTTTGFRDAFRTAAVLGAALSLSAVVPAQDEPGEDPVCERIYVNPDTGSDSNPGTVALPLATLTTAMAVATPPAVVILEPGRYVHDPFGTGEDFPIECRDDVSIQGTSAMNTILEPLGRTGLDFQTPGDFADTAYDGFTIRGADIGVLIRTEFVARKPTLSNMFLVENGIGIQMHAIFLGVPNPDDKDGNGYIEHRPKLVNLTIANNEAGIVDSSNQGLPMGQAEPAILNCIIYPNAVTDLAGVDATDIKFSDFCSVDAGLSTVRPGKGLPVPVHSLCGVADSALYIDSAAGDYRQVPGSVTVDSGSQTALVFDAGPSFPFALTVISTKVGCCLEIWDADCEGYCNDRLVGSSIDIGADEQGQAIVAGYVPFTTRFGLDSGGVLYNQMQVYFLPQGTSTTLARLYAGLVTNLSYLAWVPSMVPGARPFGTQAPTDRPGIGIVCIDESTIIGGQPHSFAMSNPITIGLMPPATPRRLSLQLLPIDINGFAVGSMSNLQSFDHTP